MQRTRPPEPAGAAGRAVTRSMTPVPRGRGYHAVWPRYDHPSPSGPSDSSCPPSSRTPSRRGRRTPPTARPDADPLAELADLCRRAEEAGADALWACDHLFWHGPCLECMVVLTVAATATERAALGTCVIQLPLRRAVAVAKQAATLQTLSRGRLILGVGVGSHPGEYEQVGAAYHRRGHDLDTAIGELHRAWGSGDGVTSGDTALDRRHRALPPAAGTRRPSRCGWAARPRRPCAGPPPGRRLDAALPRGRRVRRRRRAAGQGGRRRRSAGRVPSPRPWCCSSRSTTTATRGVAKGTKWMGSLYGLPPKAFERHLVAGTPDEVAARVAEYRAVGAEHVAVYVTDDQPIDQFERLMAALPAAGPDPELTG